MKYLVIVESPAKCGKIEKYLNDNNDLHIYKVVATMGHITELTSLKSIDIQNNFACTYELIEKKKKNTEMIRKLIKEYDEIILSCDPDREGEGIAANICQVFNLDILTTKRVTFNEITESIIVDAMKTPKTIDINLVNSQKTRQILDLLVGYKVTPILWKFITKHSINSLSAGRCQSPALKLIYENQQDINKVESKKVYNTTGYFTGLNIPFELNTQFNSEEEVSQFLQTSKDFQHIYSFNEPVKVFKTPPEPFTTSRIQQVASNELHLSPKETMKMCQKLYEAGYITYMRTDSKKYSKDFIDTVKEYILRNFSEGEKYISENINNLTTDSTNNNNIEPSKKPKKSKKTDKKETSLSQNAHEAIRPTNISLFELSDKVEPKERKLYNLIWTNTLESCLPSAIFSALKATISGAKNTQFCYTSEQIIFPGWLIVTNKYDKDTKEYKYLQMLPKGDTVPYKTITSAFTIKGIKQHYTEAKLVQLLEEKGIGRPSTFSSIIDKIQERGYVKKENIVGKKIQCKDYILTNNNISINEKEREFGNEKNKLVIQPLGIIVIEFLESHFSSLFNYDYTRKMEDDLDKISKGEKVWYELCKECNEQLDELIHLLDTTPKFEHKIDDNNSYIVGKYGPVIKHNETIDGKDVVSFKPIKKDVDVHEIVNGDLLIEDIIDTNIQKKKCILGKYDNHDVILQKGKFGLYITWGENSKTLKELGNRPAESITFDEVIKYLEEGSNMIREISASLSIRKGKKGDYLFYKTNKMKKPQFFDIKNFYKETQTDYKTCSITSLKEWIKNTHQIV